jgi:hypothetical protein
MKEEEVRPDFFFVKTLVNKLNLEPANNHSPEVGLLF